MMSSVRLAGRPAGVAHQLRGRADERRNVGRAHERGVGRNVGASRPREARRRWPAVDAVTPRPLAHVVRPRPAVRARRATDTRRRRRPRAGSRGSTSLPEREARRGAGARCRARARRATEAGTRAPWPMPGVVEAARADDADARRRERSAARSSPAPPSTRRTCVDGPLLGCFVQRHLGLRRAVRTARRCRRSAPPGPACPRRAGARTDESRRTAPSAFTSYAAAGVRSRVAAESSRPPGETTTSGRARLDRRVHVVAVANVGREPAHRRRARRP